MTRARDTLAARAFRAVLGAGLVLSLAANLPGHLSLDSVNALYEARFDTQITWAPVAYQWVVGLFDSALAGTGLYVAASSALLFASLMRLPNLRPRAAWLAVALAVVAVLAPQLLIYQGIVWRDVLFANLSIAGFVLIAGAAETWRERTPWPSLLAALAALALAAAVRQNGIVLTLAAAVAVGWSGRQAGRRGLAWGAGWFVAAIVLAFAIVQVAQPATTAPNLRPDAGMRILQHYDVVGAVAHDPALKLDAIAAYEPARAEAIRSGAARYYSAVRVDTLDPDEAFRRSLWRTPDAVMAAQWREVIFRHPADYLAHRFDVFRWVFLTPDIGLCLPVQVGVTGPPDIVAQLRVQPGVDETDRRLSNYASQFYGTPVFSHLAWAFLSLALFAVFLRRASPADRVMAALLGGSLAFAASFLAVSIACDYRYLYVVDLAAITGLLYFALDPTLKRRG